MPKGSAYVLTLVALGLVIMLAAISARWERFAPEDYATSAMRPPSGSPSVQRAVFAGGQLWLLSTDGEVWAVREGVRDAKKISVPDAAFAICEQGGAPVIATGLRTAPSAWTLHRSQNGGWTAIGSFPSNGEGFVGIACEADRVLALTSRRLVEFGGSPTRAVMLSGRIPGGLPSSLLVTPESLFVGLNVGEWGGGLQSIDRRTGEVRDLVRNATGGPCDGPLNPDCDPVNGIVSSAQKPNCVIAAVGLVHMRAHGRLVEVCGERITNLLSQACDGESARSCTLPFFGIAPAQDGRRVAVAPGKLVSLDRDGRVTPLPWPRSKAYGPFEVAFAPSYALVSTDVNRRRSMSGQTPLIAAR